jgi:hypothetical protein
VGGAARTGDADRPIIATPIITVAAATQAVQGRFMTVLPARRKEPPANRQHRAGSQPFQDRCNTIAKASVPQAMAESAFGV